MTKALFSLYLLSTLGFLISCSNGESLISVRVGAPSPTPTPIPEYTADALYIECEGTEPPHRKMLQVFMGNLPECYLEGQRLRVSGQVLKVDVVEEVGDVELVISYNLNPQNIILFGGIILRNIPKDVRASLQERERVVADCVVGQSAIVELMGTGRVLDDCTIIPTSQ